MPIKLLLYTFDWLPPVGGIQTVTLDLATGLAARRDAEGRAAFEVTLVTRTPAAGMDDAGLAFRVVRRPGIVELARLMLRADLIHMANPTLLPLALAWMLRKRVVIEHHGYQSVCPNGLLLFQPDRSICPGHFMARQYAKCVRCNAAEMGAAKSWRSVALEFPRRWLCKRVRANIAVSQHVAGRIALPRTQTIYHGVRDEGIEGRSVAAEAAGPLRIGFVGRLVTEKGATVLLEAAGRLYREGYAFHLDLVGDGPQREELEDQARGLEMESRVTFRGSLSGDELRRVRAGFSVLVVPSVCEETAGLAAMEQMMGGGMVLASEIGGMGEVVGEAGLKFAAGDAADLYRQLRGLMERPGSGAEMRGAARERAMKLFGRESMIDAHAQLYRKVLQG